MYLNLCLVLWKIQFYWGRSGAKARTADTEGNYNLHIDWDSNHLEIAVLERHDHKAVANLGITMFMLELETIEVDNLVLLFSNCPSRNPTQWGRNEHGGKESRDKMEEGLFSISIKIILLSVLYINF